ncbi:MAG: transporter substrate-binding domain-containing protein [Pseudonocardiales bacterium]|nr:transporter substrate-binding domain-containing protein [Pseudonocardiales bacterium]
MDCDPQRPWPEPEPTPSASTWSRSAQSQSDAQRSTPRSGQRRPGRIGCLLIVLVIAALWVQNRIVDTVIDLFRNHPAPVAGSTFDKVAPAPRASSGSPTIDRIVGSHQIVGGGQTVGGGQLRIAIEEQLRVAIEEAPGLAQRSPESGRYTGFDIALLGLIARDLGADPARTSFKPVPTINREGDLDRGEVDLVLGGYEITPARSAKVGIAGPYLVRSLRLAVPATSPVTSLSALGHGEVCAPEDSPAAKALADHGIGLQTRADLTNCATLLGDRLVEAIAGSQDALSALLSQEPGTLRVIDEPLGTTEYGIGLPPGDPLLRQRVTAVLRHAIDDGTWARLYAEYLGTPVPTPPVLR